jgi:hypothetical protein
MYVSIVYARDAAFMFAGAALFRPCNLPAPCESALRIIL